MANLEPVENIAEGRSRPRPALSIAVAIATTGRPAIVRQAISRLERQTRAPDRIVVVGAGEADVQGLAGLQGLTVDITEKGLCRQRNHALRMIGREADIVAFLDDDFVPASGFLAGVEQLFSEHPDVVAASGIVIADGIHSAGISFDEADALVQAYEQSAPAPHKLFDIYGAYGCNMVIRLSAAQGLAFDENLPLYGWQEDIDFTGALRKRGRVVRSNRFAGVHLGVKAGRTPGRALGYSQVVNPFYLARKGTVAWTLAARLVARNIAANTLKSLAPEPYVDRRGRLAGNLVALAELLSGKAHPTRMLRLNAKPGSAPAPGYPGDVPDRRSTPP